jgi:hypothetical protein
MKRSRIVWGSIVAAITAGGLITAASASASDISDRKSDRPVIVKVDAPHNGDVAGISGAAWFVDLAIDYPGGPSGLHQAGFTAPQLTGPGAHNNVAPLPGNFSTGQDDRLPGLVVLTSTTNNAVPGFSGPGTNLANLFNLTGVTDRTPEETEIWDTWIVGAAIAGQNIDTTLTVAVVSDLNHNGVYDDAPGVVTDVNNDGRIDAKDLEAIGVASNVVTIHFHINGGGV